MLSISTGHPLLAAFERAPRGWRVKGALSLVPLDRSGIDIDFCSEEDMKDNLDKGRRSNFSHLFNKLHINLHPNKIRSKSITFDTSRQGLLLYYCCILSLPEGTSFNTVSHISDVGRIDRYRTRALTKLRSPLAPSCSPTKKNCRIVKRRDFLEINHQRIINFEQNSTYPFK